MEQTTSTMPAETVSQARRAILAELRSCRNDREAYRLMSELANIDAQYPTR